LGWILYSESAVTEGGI